MSEAITRGIVVRVQPEFVPGQSSPAERRFLFAYHVQIENRGEETVQLVESLLMYEVVLVEDSERLSAYL